MEVRSGGTFESSFEGVGEAVVPHRHRQRHFPSAAVLAAIGAARLKAVAVFGEHRGELHPEVDENHDTKVVYVCRARSMPHDR